jgi:hypothetical protein
MEATGFSETSVDFQRTTRRFIREDRTLEREVVRCVGAQEMRNVVEVCMRCMPYSMPFCYKSALVQQPSRIGKIVNEFFRCSFFGWILNYRPQSVISHIKDEVVGF